VKKAPGARERGTGGEGEGDSGEGDGEGGEGGWALRLFGNPEGLPWPPRMFRSSGRIQLYLRVDTDPMGRVGCLRRASKHIQPFDGLEIMSTSPRTPAHLANSRLFE
jgi:hypothetical protein